MQKKFFIQNPQFELYIFSRIGLLALSLVVKQISKVEDCHCIVSRGSLSTVFDCFVISCDFLAAIFLPQSRKCYWKMIQINSWGAAFFFPQASTFCLIVEGAAAEWRHALVRLLLVASALARQNSCRSSSWNFPGTADRFSGAATCARGDFEKWWREKLMFWMFGLQCWVFQHSTVKVTERDFKILQTK